MWAGYLPQVLSQHPISGTTLSTTDPFTWGTVVRYARNHHFVILFPYSRKCSIPQTGVFMLPVYNGNILVSGSQPFDFDHVLQEAALLSPSQAIRCPSQNSSWNSVHLWHKHIISNELWQFVLDPPSRMPAPVEFSIKLVVCPTIRSGHGFNLNATYYASFETEKLAQLG